MRPMGARGSRLLAAIVQGAGLGGSIGAATALAVGAVIGAIVGQYNEATLAGDAHTELFVGFAEYSMWGMALWSALICAVYGGAAGAASDAASQVSRRRTAGLVVGVALPLLLWVSTDLFHDGRNQAGFVWCAGMLAGSVAASLSCANRRAVP